MHNETVRCLEQGLGGMRWKQGPGIFRRFKKIIFFLLDSSVYGSLYNIILWGPCIDNFDFTNSSQNSWAHVRSRDQWMKNFKSPSARKGCNAKALRNLLILKQYWSSCSFSSSGPFLVLVPCYSCAVLPVLPRTPASSDKRQGWYWAS